MGIVGLVGMRLRRVPPSRIVHPLIKATKAGLELTTNQLEAHFLAGGNVDRVVNALIAAHRAGIPPSRLSVPLPSIWPAAMCWKQCK